MRSDMGLSELMASVVVGIAIPSRVIEAAAAGVMAGAARAPCGAAAFALCCMTARESTATDTTGKNKIIHRIFMDTNLYSLWDGIIRQAHKGRHPGDVRYASLQVKALDNPPPLDFRSWW